MRLAKKCHKKSSLLRQGSIERMSAVLREDLVILWQKNVTRKELAFKAGLHRTYVSSIERGSRNPTLQIISKMAKALSTSECELLRNEIQNPPIF